MSETRVRLPRDRGAPAGAAGLRPADPVRVAALGVVLGLAVLTRAEAGVLGVLLLAGLLARPGPTSGRLLRRAGLAALGLVLMAVVVVPWTIRNQQTFHQLVPVSNNLGTALAGANCRLTYFGDRARVVALDVRRRRRRRRASASPASTAASPDSTRRGPPPTPGTAASPSPATISATSRRSGSPGCCGPSVYSVPSSRSGSRRSKGARSAGSGPAPGWSGCCTRSPSPAPCSSSGDGPRSGRSRRRC